MATRKIEIIHVAHVFLLDCAALDVTVQCANKFSLTFELVFLLLAV